MNANSFWSNTQNHFLEHPSYISICAEKEQNNHTKTCNISTWYSSSPREVSWSSEAAAVSNALNACM